MYSWQEELPLTCSPDLSWSAAAAVFFVTFGGAVKKDKIMRIFWR